MSDPTASEPQPSTTFDQIFRQIRARKIGGGPKATEADELLFCGDLGSGTIFLTSRVRLRDPNESFYASSSHRLRDSHVGSGGHWIDIRVQGNVTNDQLAIIKALAQAADQQPVKVRRTK